MPRNLVICCDGTSNQFGKKNTNVVRLVQVLDRDPTKQWLYYDPGVGTLPEPDWGPWIRDRIKRLAELGIGVGLTDNVEEAYSYLMDFWEPGDDVFLFGFSRGAYTVRVLAGMLHAIGLLPRGSYNLVPYAMRLFKSLRETCFRRTIDWNLCDAFRTTFAREIYGHRERRFPVRFLGVWDTVSSVGWLWDPTTFRFTRRNPSIKVVRHAVAVDERRAFFRQNLFGQVPGQDLKEMWFPGSHCDVGGGLKEEAGALWKEPFAWLVREAKQAGLYVDEARFDEMLGPPGDYWAEPQHESLEWYWWPAEFVPKWGVHGPRINLGRNRFIPLGAAMHRSILLRVRANIHVPRSFSDAFVGEIRALPEVPDSLPFRL